MRRSRPRHQCDQPHVEALRLTVPRDRDGSFEPELVKKGQTRIDGIDDKIIGLYAHGLYADAGIMPTSVFKSLFLEEIAVKGSA